MRASNGPIGRSWWSRFCDRRPRSGVWERVRTTGQSGVSNKLLRADASLGRKGMPLFRREKHGAPLLAQSKKDPALFAEFYREYARRVVVFFTRRTLDPDLALELTAETFSIALERRNQFRGSTTEEEQGWLFAIARSQLSLYARRGRVERAATERLGIQTPRWSADEIDRVDELAGTQRLRDEVGHVLGHLPRTQQAAIVMRVLGDLGYDEIAEKLDVSEDVVRARVSRGLRRMRESLGDVAEADRTQ